jgi:hypothetical protein
MVGQGSHRGRHVDIGDEDDQPHHLTPDLVPGPGRKVPDPLEGGLHAARERHPEGGQQQPAENARRAQDPAGRGGELYHRMRGGAATTPATMKMTPRPLLWSVSIKTPAATAIRPATAM